MRPLIALWILLSGVTLMGQEGGRITGTVRDAANGEAMVAVNISANKRSGTISGSEGEFMLEVPAGKHLVEFFYVGYERVSREVALDQGEVISLEIEMEVSSRMLDEVVVSAGKFEQKLSDVTVSLEVLKPHQLSNQNITSLGIPYLRVDSAYIGVIAVFTPHGNFLVGHPVCPVHLRGD